MSTRGVNLCQYVAICFTLVSLMIIPTPSISQSQVVLNDTSGFGKWSVTVSSTIPVERLLGVPTSYGDRLGLGEGFDPHSGWPVTASLTIRKNTAWTFLGCPVSAGCILRYEQNGHFEKFGKYPVCDDPPELHFGDLRTWTAELLFGTSSSTEVAGKGIVYAELPFARVSAHQWETGRDSRLVDALAGGHVSYDARDELNISWSVRAGFKYYTRSRIGFEIATRLDDILVWHVLRESNWTVDRERASFSWKPETRLPSLELGVSYVL
jgi:hypothetical protein